MMERPSFIGHYSQFFDDDNAHYPGSDELLSIGSAVGKKLGLVKIGIHIETLLPGRRTSFPHAESEEEEFGFVIEGEPHVWIDGYLHALKPGDFVAFPSGTGMAHTFINNSSANVRLLVGGERSKPTNRIVYPLNDEMNLVKKTKGELWEDHPKRELGPHHGKPDVPKNGKWNLPVFETNRLILRPFEFTDVPNVFKYASNPNVAATVTWEPHQTEEDTKAFVKFAHNCYVNSLLEPYAVCLKTNPNIALGSVGLFWSSKPNRIIEFGVVLDENYWGQGIMGEALEKMIAEGWSYYNAIRIQGRCLVGNMKSRRMMEKLGMTYEGTIRKSLVCKGRSWDLEMFSLINPQDKV